MLKIIVSVFLFVTFSKVIAGEINFNQSGNSIIHPEFINNELCKVKNSLFDILPTTLKCTDVKIDFNVTKETWFKPNSYSISASANCPQTIVDVKLYVEIAPCEECHTETRVSVLFSSGEERSIKARASEARYLCRFHP